MFISSQFAGDLDAAVPQTTLFVQWTVSKWTFRNNKVLLTLRTGLKCQSITHAPPKSNKIPSLYRFHLAFPSNRHGELALDSEIIPLFWVIWFTKGGSIAFRSLGGLVFHPRLESCWLIAFLRRPYCALIIMAPKNRSLPRTPQKTEKHSLAGASQTRHPCAQQPPACLRKVMWGTLTLFISWQPQLWSTLFFF